ncbi:uncharacterized protein N7503_010686 [Penicillium pulvis]|uniref:uncharacterized protein n=1 Tax=Penicillium pulvis TaxID=1562058 RepID=UPI002546B493|nr:uncharacterized protein N7503_010686 [Penicillium pulvis]KAJ5785474.1 hypothetical protein N7503_010686 [Penicillium pulvis]
MTLTALRVHRVSGKLHRQDLALRATDDISANERLCRFLACVWVWNAGTWLGRGMPCVRTLQWIDVSQSVAKIWILAGY